MAGVRSMLTRKMGPVGLALTAYDIWRRIPPQHQRRLLQQARRHGPKIAMAVLAARRRRRDR